LPGCRPFRFETEAKPSALNTAIPEARRQRLIQSNVAGSLLVFGGIAASSPEGERKWPTDLSVGAVRRPGPSPARDERNAGKVLLIGMGFLPSLTGLAWCSAPLPADKSLGYYQWTGTAVEGVCEEWGLAKVHLFH